MIFTLGDAIPFVSRFVGSGGSCPSSQVVKDRINEAIRRLLEIADWKNTQQPITVQTFNNTLTLPYQFEAARLLLIDGVPRRIFNRGYSYMEGGPGAYDHNGTGAGDLVDLGNGYPTLFDLPKYDPDVPYYLIAGGTDSGSLTVWGRDTQMKEVVNSSGISGYTLPISNWADGVEGNFDFGFSSLAEIQFRTIDSIKLPEGRKDHVSLFAYNPDNHYMVFLAKYAPQETRPDYRRYQIRGMDCKDRDGDATCVNVLAKSRYVPAVRDDDVLLIQHLDAIKSMVISIREENAGDVQGSVLWEQRALQMLNNQLVDQHRGEHSILQMHDPLAVGRIPRV